MSIYNFWQKKTIANYLLYPLAGFWALGGIIRKLKSKPYKSNLFVICIGNINLGGAGKTPTAIKLGELLKQAGFSVVYLSKGYGGYAKKPTWVSGQSYKEVGDEPLLLAEVLPTLVCKDLVLGLKTLEKQNDIQIVITDDGLQNPNFIKDYKVLVVNGGYGFGNGLGFPVGPLRQSIAKGINNVDSILVLDEDKANISVLAKKYHKPIFFGHYEPQEIDEKVKNSPIFAFCGIAMPQKFLNTLKKCNLKVVKTAFFKDHHSYSNVEISSIIKQAKDNNMVVLTTKKDYVKLDKAYKNDIYCLNIKEVIKNENDFIKPIINKYENKL
jgi:tetraacyldisaccharide 4'-kinase